MCRTVKTSRKTCHVFTCWTCKVVVQRCRVLRWPCQTAAERIFGSAVCRTAWSVYHHLSCSLWCWSTDLEEPWTVLGKVSGPRCCNWPDDVTQSTPKKKAKDGDHGGRIVPSHLIYHFHLIAHDGNGPSPFLSLWIRDTHAVNLPVAILWGHFEKR